MHHGLHPIKLNLTHHQIRKAHAGHPIQIPHHAIGSGVTVHVHPETHKKLVKAHHGRKGARIHLTHHELAGSGFLDVLKKVASPVISGLAGVAGEIFPSHKDTINKVREGIRSATGYGIRAKQMHKGHPMHSAHKGFSHGGAAHMRVPKHMPGYHSDHYGSGMDYVERGVGTGFDYIQGGVGTGVRKHKKKTTKKKKAPKRIHMGSGALPAGYGY